MTSSRLDELKLPPKLLRRLDDDVRVAELHLTPLGGRLLESREQALEVFSRLLAALRLDARPGPVIA